MPPPWMPCKWFGVASASIGKTHLNRCIAVSLWVIAMWTMKPSTDGNMISVAMEKGK